MDLHLIYTNETLNKMTLPSNECRQFFCPSVYIENGWSLRTVVDKIEWDNVFSLM
jgi:hypothetical protein